MHKIAFLLCHQILMGLHSISLTYSLGDLAASQPCIKRTVKSSSHMTFPFVNYRIHFVLFTFL